MPAAYAQVLMRLNYKVWLLQNCTDPLFFSKMLAHTTVCSKMEANELVFLGSADGSNAEVLHFLGSVAGGSTLTLIPKKFLKVICICTTNSSIIH